MSNQSFQVAQEPKKIFVATLIKQMAQANYFIFVLNGQQSKGLEILDGVISTLGEAHQEALKETHQKVRDGAMTGGPRVDAREMYQTVSRYLAKTYYEEMQIGIIPTASLAGDQPAPEEKIKSRVKAKL